MSYGKPTIEDKEEAERLFPSVIKRMVETYDPDCARPANEYDALCKIEYQLKRIADIMERIQHYGIGGIKE